MINIINKNDPSAIEFDAEGNRRINVFYCDPSPPYQKGPIEVFEQLYWKSILEKLDVKRVNPNDIVLHPDLLK